MPLAAPAARRRGCGVGGGVGVSSGWLAGSCVTRVETFSFLFLLPSIHSCFFLCSSCAEISFPHLFVCVVPVFVSPLFLHSP